MPLLCPSCTSQLTCELHIPERKNNTLVRDRVYGVDIHPAAVVQIGASAILHRENLVLFI